jgi:hypothetical protein
MGGIDDLATFPSPSSSKVLPRFSYTTFTQLQVNGARDRAQRQLEKLEWERRLQEAKGKLQHAMLTVQDQRIYHDELLNNETHQNHAETIVYRKAVQNALCRSSNIDNEAENKISSYIGFQRDAREQQYNRDISPILLHRLAVLLQHEYRAAQLSKTLEDRQNDQRKLIRWLELELKSAENEKKRIVEHEGKVKIREVECQMQISRLQYIENCHRILEEKRQVLLKLHRLKMEHIREWEIKKHMVIKRPGTARSYGTTHSGSSSLIASSKWLSDMLDENYFLSPSMSSSSDNANLPNGVDDASSEWVVCGHQQLFASHDFAKVK